MTLNSGASKTGLRVEMAENSQLSGRVFQNGKPYKGGHVVVRAESIGAGQNHPALANPIFAIAVRKDNYRLKVVSTDGAFPTFYATDPTDGNQVFHANGVNKITGVRTDVP